LHGRERFFTEGEGLEAAQPPSPPQPASPIRPDEKSSYPSQFTADLH
jgi:hypothetical protein